MMNNLSIAIIDYQAGNLRSVQKALERTGVCPKITSDPSDIEVADAVVFPGQGACDSAMRRLKEKDLIDSIVGFIDSGKPFLGVCLGLQLLLQESDEGVEPCLGVLTGRDRRLPSGIKIPHMGWNQVTFHSQHPVFEGIPSGSYFYFVHSYYADPEDKEVVSGTTIYGIEFCSAVTRANMIAVQFHPEKSGVVGLKIYDNFVGLVKTGIMAGAWKSFPQ